MKLKSVNDNLYKLLKIVDLHDAGFSQPKLDELRDMMRQIMSDSYIQGSHDCADSLLGVKK